MARDASGAAVPQAQVTLTNLNTNQKSTQPTSAEGNYTFPLVPPGTYQLEAERTGFKKFVRRDIAVEVQQQTVIDVVMEVGETTQSIEVRETSPLLESTTSALGQVVDSRKVLDLPLAGRNVMGLIGLTTGAQPVGPQFGGIYARTSSYAQGFFSISGGQLVTSDALMDGVSIIGSMFNAPTYSPVADAVQEFKVQTNNLSAEYGRTGGGVVNILTRSGDNSFRGSLYEFFRNDRLNANNWFSNQAGQPRPHTTTNQFGGTVGGPVLLPGYNGHDKTFWFFNYEGLRDRRAFPQVFTVPMPQQLQGDFSRTFNAAGQLITIADPATTRPDPSGPGKYLRDVFPNNMIPASRIDPVAAKVRTLWGPPNAPGTLTGANNFVSNGAQANGEDQANARIDHTIGQNHRIFGRFSWSDDLRGAYDFFHNGAGYAIPEGNGVPFIYNARNTVLGYTYTISPTLLTDFRYGFVRQYVYKDPASTGLDLTTLGFPASFNQQVFAHALPAFAPSGYRALAPANADLLHRADNAHSLQGSLTKVLSRHTLKAGAYWRYMFDGELQPNAAQGSFSFDGRFTSTNPLAVQPNSGQAIASFLLGVPSSGTIDFMPAISISYRYFGTYLQDDFRVSSKLTLNLGIRYELQTARDERYNRLSWFDPNATNPRGTQVGLPNLKGGLQFAGADGNPRRQENMPGNNVGPRFGLAYNLTPNTVLRGGYGIFFLPVTGDDIGRSLGGEGFFATTTFLSSTDGGITPANYLANPFPNGLVQPTGSSKGLASQLGQDLQTVLRNNGTAYAQEFNFDIQRKVRGNILIDAAYAGNKGTRLPVNIQLNQLPDQYLSLGSALLAQVRNPFASFVTAGTLSQPTVAAGQLLRPFPEFGNISGNALHAGSFIYHSFQLKVERRFSRGFSFLAAYTLSKNIGDSTSRLANSIANPSYQDSNNRRAERSLSNIDISQRLVLSYGLELPFGPGKPLLNSAGGLLAHLAGGWQINGITTFQRGVPLGLTTSANQTNSFGGGSRPNNSGQSAKLNGPVEDRLNRYFNTSVFSQPAAFTFGNTARTLPDVRAPGVVNFDFSLIKNTRLHERATMQFRAEFFNFLNNVNFGAPGTTFGTGTFGVISSASDARVAQVALKFSF